jgi:hypothetical protein
METVLKKQPDYAEAISALGMIDAGLCRKEDAIKEGRRAVELLPVTKDVMTGSELLRNLALIYVWTGEKELALDQIAAALQGPVTLRMDSYVCTRGGTQFGTIRGLINSSRRQKNRLS